MERVGAMLRRKQPLDEEGLRQHRLEKLRFWTLRAQEEIKIIDQEINMLNRMAERAAKAGGGEMLDSMAVHQSILRRNHFFPAQASQYCC